MTMLDDSRVYARADRVTVRRRKVALTLAALGAAVALAAVATGLGAFWLALFVVVVLGGLYGLLMRLADRRAVEKEFGRWESELGNFELFGNDMAPIRDGSGQFDVKAMPHTNGRGEKASRVVVDTVRFVACNAAGWALAPLVFALTIVVGRTPSDTTGQRWLANLRDTQEKLEEGSRRTVALAATTASVTVVSTAVVFGGATAANAAPVSTHATSSVTTASVGAAAGSANVVNWPLTSATGPSGGIDAVLTSASSSTSYTVRAGDTLDSIAMNFSTTYENLAAINHIGDPNLIYPGQVLQLDGNPQAAQPTPTVTTPSNGESSSTSYTVRAGDTLDSIAMNFSTTYENLAAINHIGDPNLIYPGQVLQLDGNPQAAQPTPAVTTPSNDQSSPSSPRAAGSALPPSQTAAQLAVRMALEQVGKPYVWAGAGPNDFDCSGLVMYAWDAAGVSLPHYSVAQFDDTARITKAELEPGDLVFYNNGSGPQPGHVTLYVGNGQVVAADYPGSDVRLEPMGYDGTPMAFGRVQ